MFRGECLSQSLKEASQARLFAAWTHGLIEPAHGLPSQQLARARHQERSKRQRDKNQKPDPTAEEIVVGQQPGPCGSEDVVADEKLKGDGHQDPPTPNQ